MMIENATSILTMDDDLHVFIPNDLSFIKSIGNFIKMYSLRTRIDREYWLLDVSYWPSVNDAINDLEELKLDLDDDLFLYSSNKRMNTSDGPVLKFIGWSVIGYRISPSISRSRV